MTAIDPRAFRTALGSFATGVTIVTAIGPRGQLVGLTANSFSSVSLDPPLILFSLDRKAFSIYDFLSTGHFAVNVLASDQQELSSRFARSGGDKFAGVAYDVWDHGCPVLHGSHAQFECSIAYTYSGGDHVIFVGQVERMAFDPDKKPLLYYRGAYRDLEDLPA